MRALVVVTVFLLPVLGSSQDDTERVVLEGVPRIGYDVHLCPFVGSLSSALEYLEEPADYDFLMGVTGAAFRRFWNRDDGGNVDLMYLAPEPYVRAGWAVGRELRPVSPEDREVLLSELRTSLAAGKPVLACGIIGRRPGDWVRRGRGRPAGVQLLPGPGRAGLL